MPAVNFNRDSLCLPLKQIKRIPRLSHQVVLCYARQVQQMMRLLELKQALWKRLDQEPTYTQWATQAQLSEAALSSSLEQGQWAKRKLIEANLGLVVAIARRYQSQEVDLQDLIQEGTIGLSRAVDKFDPAAGRCFSTYAYWWIRREISRCVTDKVNRAIAPVGPEQQQCLEAISLNNAVIRGESTEILDLLKSEAPLPEEIVVKLERTELVRHLVDQLPDRQKSVLMLLYGLKDSKPRSLTQAAKELALSRDQVRWAHSVALETLRTNSPQTLSLIS